MPKKIRRQELQVQGMAVNDGYVNDDRVIGSIGAILVIRIRKSSYAAGIPQARSLIKY